MAEDKEKEEKVLPVILHCCRFQGWNYTEEVFFLFMIQLGLLMKDKRL